MNWNAWTDFKLIIAVGEPTMATATATTKFAHRLYDQTNAYFYVYH